MYNAVQRNFEILKKLCKQQQDEFKASMDHANVVNDQFKQLSNKYTELEQLKEKTDEENIYYRRKEIQFNKALEEKIQMQLQIDDYIAKTNRQQRVNRDLETNNKILTADNKQLKLEILRYTERNQQLENDKAALQSKIDAMDLKMKSDALVFEDLQKSEERNTEKIAILEKKCKDQNEEIQDKTIYLEQLEDEKTQLGYNVRELQQLLDLKTKQVADLERKLQDKTNAEQQVTKELSLLTILHEKLKIDSRNKYEDMQRKCTLAEESLFKTQVELKTLNQKYVSEVKTGVEKLQSATEDRNELNQIITELREENQEMKSTCNELRLELQRVKIDSTLEIQAINNQMSVTSKELEAAIVKLELEKGELLRTSTKATQEADEKTLYAKEARSELMAKSKELIKA